VASWSVLLAQAQADLARGDFLQAQAHAETALRSNPPKAVRATALLVTADAASALQLHRLAARHYGEIVDKHGKSAEAPLATMGLAWAELRQGDRRRARRTWTRLADTFPTDPRAPLALALAAEVASEAGDLSAAQVLLDRIIARHARTPQAESARLSRSIVLLRRHREDDAVRDLDAVVQAGGTSAIDERGRLIASLGAPRADIAVAALPVAAAANGNGQRPPRSSDALEQFATAFLDTHDRSGAPYVLHGLVVLAATSRGWTDPLVGTLASRLVDDFPTYPPASALLARVGASAVTAGQWPVVRRAYESLVTRDPASPFAQSVRVDLAEALLRTGAAAEARRHLDDVGASGRATPRVLLLQAEVSETLGDRRSALAAYDRLLAEHPDLPREPRSLLSHARLLEDSGQPAPARLVLQRVVARAGGEVAAEAAYRLATILSAAREHQTAVEWYLTAAYAADGSRWARPALLGAGGSMTALNETKEALAIYQKLVSSTNGRAEDGHVGGEAAYRAAEIFRVGQRHEAALDMYLTSAHLTAGSAAERRALVGAVRCLVATGDRASAEVIYRRLLESSATEPELLAGARQALRAAGSAVPVP
jgi:TolA-binding protein